MADIIKRMVAFVIDWNLCLFPSFILLLLLAPIAMSSTGEITAAILIYMLLFCGLILASFVIFVFRDVIFKGRSIGKRIFRLHIFDKDTKQEVSAGKRIVKNLFFFIYPVDAIVMLASGSSIGNFLTNTEVISEKTMAMRTNMEYKPTSKKKIALGIVGAVVLYAGLMICSFLLMFNFVQKMLDQYKGTEQYSLAYEYFVESDAFEALEELGYSKSDITMTGYSSSKNLVPDEEGATETATLKFKVDYSEFTVICHRIDGEWQVCEDCTAT